MQKRKNQHFVPQFYLKNFALEENELAIGLYNPKSNVFVQSTSIKNQSSKDFFYGKDGRIEENLSKIENILAPHLTKVTSDLELPKKNSDEHISLLTFVVLTDLRNPVKIRGIKEMPVLINELLNKGSDSIKNYIPDFTQDYAVELSLDNYSNVLKTCLDLDYKLLLNNSKRPFITSDFPVLKYNQFLEKKQIHGSKTGYAVLGVQIFVPLNPKLCLLYYDPNIYKVGNRKDKIIELDSHDIDQLNLLQFLNCSNNLYFNQEIDKEYIDLLNSKSKKFEKANVNKASIHGVMNSDGGIEENREIIHMRSSDLLTGISISGIKIQRKANSLILKSGITPTRPKVEEIIKNYR